MCKRVEMQSVKQLIASQKVFQIAYYQRGYRWREQQITQLLDDLCGFVKTHKNPFYFMQALVVVNEEENKWRVIDGQQRLTSIKLILQKIFPDSSDNNSNIKMEYERNLQQQEVGALDAHFRDKTTEIIDNYLKNLSNEAKEKLGKSIKECEFLLYNLGGIAEEESVFNRLNSGKIGAKESELIKCVMLTPQLDEPDQVTIARAQEWDNIERELSNDSFFYFMATEGTPYIYDRMAHLLHIAGIIPCENDNERFPMLKRTYAILTENGSSKSREQLWQDIYSTFYTLKAWFIDKNAWEYHAFGWKVHRKGGKLPENLKIDMNEMSAIWGKGEKYTDLSPEKNQDIFNEDKELAINLLFLFNVAYCWRRGLKYDFAEHAKIPKWSLEHIHARNQEKLSWEDLGMLCNLEYSDYEKACTQEDPKGAKWLDENLKEGYPRNDDNSLGNLALLPCSDNSSLNNGFFNAKRRTIISRLQKWIPNATRDVFAKSLPGLDFNKSYWGEVDRKAYVKFIQETIYAFLPEGSK